MNSQFATHIETALRTRARGFSVGQVVRTDPPSSVKAASRSRMPLPTSPTR
jgi:hypothetical protein